MWGPARSACKCTCHQDWKPEFDPRTHMVPQDIAKMGKAWKMEVKMKIMG